MVKIVVDSTADLPRALYQKYDITVVPVLAQFGDQTLRDDIDFTRDEFYARLVASPEPPKTAAPSVGMFESAFRPLAEAGHEILSISLAGDLSGTYNAARQAAQLVEGARIACVDSYTVTMSMGFLVLKAAEALRDGATLEQATALLEELRTRTVLFVAFETLRYLEKGGRIGRMRALLGTMLSVKPIMEVRLSEVHPLEQVRTWKRVPPRMIELAQQRGAFDQLAVLYSTTRDAAEQMADQCAAAGLLPRGQIFVEQAGGVLGTHAGPGALGLAGLLK
ncbi:MAG TPA: DegV family protein [Kouleothrix sp.]|uniref:DegV family protein n=1 Tax=Kouleothrix sp. TaxID=2779161 RepID=UPI002C227A07|nr:DegV family protein [Kouleothrix sp.]HRC75658.1 DegV family protein [Kouleothrix sp.]